VYGLRVYGFNDCALGRDGIDGSGFAKAGKTSGSEIMSSMELMYSLGGIVSALLLVYLVYALFRAEEF
jgi:K+-transporting ATPase KdpF subunit